MTLRASSRQRFQLSRTERASTSRIGAAQCGFEISGTGDIATDFTCNEFSMTIN